MRTRVLRANLLAVAALATPSAAQVQEKCEVSADQSVVRMFAAPNTDAKITCSFSCNLLGDSNSELTLGCVLDDAQLAADKSACTMANPGLTNLKVASFKRDCSPKQ